MMLQPGARARLVGLQARPELNGCDVAVLECLGDRWAVLCPSGKMIKVKPTNLTQTTSAGDAVLQAFAKRLQLSGADQYSPFDAHSLLHAAGADFGAHVRVLDRSEQLALGTSTLHGSTMMLALRLIATLLSEAEGALVFAQRSPENSAGFAAVFALMRHGKEIEAKEATPIPIQLPGWLAWNREDYFFAAPSYDLSLSTRVLVDFTRGGGECCICLEGIRSGGPSTGLDCGHIIHEQCLQRCLQQPAAPSCPLCRQPIVLKTLVPFAPQQSPQPVVPRVPTPMSSSAAEEDEGPSGCKCC